MGMNPPERRTVECDTCAGAGEYVEYEEGQVLYEGECGACDGTGQISIHEAAEHGALDNWKEAI